MPYKDVTMTDVYGTGTTSTTWRITSTDATFTNGADVTISVSLLSSNPSNMGFETYCYFYVNTPSGYKRVYPDGGNTDMGSTWKYRYKIGGNSSPTSTSLKVHFPVNLASDWTTSSVMNYKAEFYTEYFGSNMPNGGLITSVIGSLTFANCDALSPWCQASQLVFWEAASNVPSDWGFTQSLSKLKTVVSSTVNGSPVTTLGKYGATIKSYKVEVNGQTKTSTTNTIIMDNLLTSAGNIPVKVTLTDSRGLSASATKNITVNSYSKPNVKFDLLFRCNAEGVNDEDSAYAKVVPIFSIYEDQPNEVTASSIEYSIYGTNTWTTAEENIVSEEAYIIGDNTLSTKQKYNVRINVSDKATTNSITSIIEPSSITLDFRKGGKGIAFGEASTQDGFVCNMPTIFRHTFSFSDPAARKNSMHNLSFIGNDVTGGKANDTREFWMSKGNCVATFGSLDMVNGQPNQWGFVVSLVHGTDVHQEWWTRSNGAHYRRGCNASSTNMPGWTQIFDAAAIVPVANGGTGSNTAAGARANLATLSATNANGYYGMGRPDGNTSDWIRTTSNGIIPYKSNSTDGASSLGTSSWPFGNTYSINGYFNQLFIRGTQLTAAKPYQWLWSGTLAKGGVIYANGGSGIKNYRLLAVRVNNSPGWLLGYEPTVDTTTNREISFSSQYDNGTSYGLKAHILVSNSDNSVYLRGASRHKWNLGSMEGTVLNVTAIVGII